uniref:Uncharacterized protein n=1 Tax=Craspedostauros australis TaxID=1486917 RepID=A0A7R9ZKB1_9STRA|mmetsp:Transcript_11030/g.30457  ORF Transcript_11030/g.30457 Transcript_11030/m.30457 type:complete len:257 (+) Transcript_11030:403-1173(+)|eukprot:CAMPEP_0198122656 /NCGR_PEP_ID=MMETSP1442-20131203/35474_1 /TAXON_ID= /ORGANISM="Craspedostauros australis, Strain CCMP3328" /LENGTH=256 /DNA_ID=CAMNT_0043781731 /DNA_START=369 /DNA_END=1139 /DNA_ORIENTATION=+
MKATQGMNGMNVMNEMKDGNARARRQRGASRAMSSQRVVNRLLMATSAMALVACNHVSFVGAVESGTGAVGAIRSDSRRRLRSRGKSDSVPIIPASSSEVDSKHEQPHMAAHLRRCSLDGDFLELFHHHVCNEIGQDQWEKVHADPHEYFASKFPHPADFDQQLRGRQLGAFGSQQGDPSHGPCAAKFFTELIEELKESTFSLFHEEATLLTLQMGMCNKMDSDQDLERMNDPSARAARSRWLKSKWDSIMVDPEP